MNFAILRRDFPQALACFDAWEKVKGPINGWGKYGPIEKMPHEMSMGIMLAFFREQNLMLATTYGGDGSMEVRLYRLNKTTGRFVPFIKAMGHAVLQHDVSWQRAFIKAFRELDKRIRGMEDDSVTDSLEGVPVSDGEEIIREE